jgi:hypothetical protein
MSPVGPKRRAPERDGIRAPQAYFAGNGIDTLMRMVRPASVGIAVMPQAARSSRPSECTSSGAR